MPAKRPTLEEIVEAHARSLVDSGETPGIGVALVVDDGDPIFFTYGAAVAGDGTTPPVPFSPDTLFEIASNTKVFTTNLLGQRVADGELRLDEPLSDFDAQLGKLKPPTRRITLGQLADFTGGIANQAPRCGNPRVPGCLPSGRPSTGRYTPKDFVDYFGTVVPYDFRATPPGPASRLPAPYKYSNFSIGLLGLLLASPPGEPFDDTIVHRWFEEVRAEILVPLGMHDTFLHVPRGVVGRKASGYQQATARAEIRDGSVTGVVPGNRGARYAQPPRVTIKGGGGSGATAVATLHGNALGKIAVTNGGSGYVAPARIVFNNGGSTDTAQAFAIVSGDRVVSIAVRDGGAGYQRAPGVRIVDGRRAQGRDATATAHLVNGRVGYVTVDDPGAGYVAPLSVVVAAPDNVPRNAITVWAAAGALTSTLRDMARFAKVAVGADDSVPARIAKGFEIAQRPYACQGATDPGLAACPPDKLRSGLAWQVQPADVENGVPAIVTKNGGLPGYWSQIALMPDADLGVVVFMNSHPGNPKEVLEAIDHVAGNILYALYDETGGPPETSR